MLLSYAFKKVLVPFWLMGCGSISPDELRDSRSQNNLLHDQRSNDQSADKPPPNLGLSTKLNWQIWPCSETNNDSQTDIVVDGNVIDIQGKGPFVFPLDDGASDSDALNLHLIGNFCKGVEFGRRITFVIDVSESMRDRWNHGTDPIHSGGTCRRLDALRAVVESFSNAENVQFALITFDSGIKSFSGGFYTQDAFLAKYAFNDYICPVGDETNYRVALEKAEMLLASVERGMSREVYFISDGLPSSTADYGVEAAGRIKETGMIATILIGANDFLLKNQIASETPDGQRMHISLQNAAELPGKIMDFNFSSMRGGDFTYAALDNLLTATRIPLAMAEGNRFDISNIRPAYEKFSAGLRVSLQFWDNRGALFTRTGYITWNGPLEIVFKAE